MDPEKKRLNFFFPTKCVIPKSLKFSHWLSEYIYIYMNEHVLMVAMDSELHIPSPTPDLGVWEQPREHISVRRDGNM